MKIKKAKMAEDPGFNMTPMIDVVFQLLIFFMLVTEVAAMEIERAYLPIATEAVEDDQPDKARRRPRQDEPSLKKVKAAELYVTGQAKSRGEAQAA